MANFNGKAHLEKQNQFLGCQKLPFTQKYLEVKILILIYMLFIFSTPMVIRHLWQLKAVVFLHRCRYLLFYCQGQLGISGSSCSTAVQRGENKRQLTKRSWVRSPCPDEKICWPYLAPQEVQRQCPLSPIPLIRCQCYKTFFLRHLR